MGLALCAIVALRLIRTPQTPAAVPTPSYSPRPQRVLALLGDRSDPWCAPLFDQLGPWAKDRGWSLTTYDCAGSVQTQRGQMEDLLCAEAAAVLLYDLGDREWQTEAVERLAEAGVQTVTLSRRGEADVGPAPGQPWAAAMEYLNGGRALLLTDLPDDPGLPAIQSALGDRLAGHGACWSTPEYAADYLDRALPLYPQVSGVLALSRAGALGAKDYIEEHGLSVKVVTMDPSPETETDLALGRMDAVVEVSPAGILDALAQALDGKTPEPLAVSVKTSEPSLG